MRPTLFTAALILASPARALDQVPCNGVEFVVLNAATGHPLSHWTTPGLAGVASPFAVSPNGKALYAGIRICEDKSGAAVREAALPEDGRLGPRVVKLGVPELNERDSESPDPAWTNELSPLPSSSDDAVTLSDKLLFLDRTEADPKLKLIRLWSKPEVHVLPNLPPGKAVRDLVLSHQHAFVFVNNAELFCFDLDGKFLWKSALAPNDGFILPTERIRIYEDGDRLLVGVTRAGLFSLDIKTGKTLWQFTYAHVYGSPRMIRTKDKIILGPAR